MTKHVWADPDSFVRAPSQAAAVLRLMELPKIDSYLKALTEKGGPDLSALQRLSENTLVTMSGDDHLTTRRILAPFFSRTGLRGWKPFLAQANTAAADTLSLAAAPDLVRDFTIPLFLDLMPNVLGLKLNPAGDHFQAVETVQRITEPYLSVATLRAMNAAVEYLIFTVPDPEGTSAPVPAAETPETLLRYLYRRRSELPDHLDPRYLVLGLFVGANSATQSLAFALHGLLTGPRAAWRDAASSGWATRETQRLLGLYQSTRTLVRVAKEPVEIEGCSYHAGQTAVVDIVAANTCMRAASGNSSAHMSFGSGQHRCPGSFLSEMVIEASIPALARRFPDLMLHKERCRFVQTPMMQAPVALPCEVYPISGRASAKLVDIHDLPSARHVLRDDAAFAPPPMADHLAALAQKSGRDFGTAISIARNALFFMDGDRHGILRNAITRQLGAQRQSQWSTMIDSAVSDALDDLAQISKPDLVAGFSERIRQHAIAPILGIHPTDKARFEQIAPGIQQVLEPWLPLRELERVQDIFAEALSLMAAPPAADSAPSLLGDLLAAPPDGFTPQDLKAVALVLYGASFNLSHTLANILHWVLTRPVEERSGIAEPDWIEHHLEELLALSSSPKYIYRISRYDAKTGDLALTSGDTTRLVVHSLNHQTLAGAGHVSFGHGLHRCIGAGLSRLAIKRSVPALFARYPNISLIAQGHAYFAMSQTVALSALPCALNTTRRE